MIILKIFIVILLLLFTVWFLRYFIYMNNKLDEINHMEHDIQQIDAITQLRQKRKISNRTYKRWLFIITNKL